MMHRICSFEMRLCDAERSSAQQGRRGSRESTQLPFGKHMSEGGCGALEARRRLEGQDRCRLHSEPAAQRDQRRLE